MKTEEIEKLAEKEYPYMPESLVTYNQRLAFRVGYTACLENSFTIEDMEDFELWKQKQFYIFNHHTKKWISENDEDENTMCIERTTADLIQLWKSERTK